ncbi:MAG: DUF5069 domain-containing protein [Vampirovibrionales bacterium]|nr:DUF5069 domain-containing protein [Vampirovibrionales bacterium]
MTTTFPEPRSGSETVAGIPWLARMIDKSRLEAEGTITALDLEYPCPMDQRLLSQLGVDAKTFQAITTHANSDAEIIEALQTAGASLSA